MHGFRKVEMTDHQTAAYLAKHGAIDRYAASGNANIWSDPQGRAVLVIIYKGEGGLETDRWIPENEEY